MFTIHSDIINVISQKKKNKRDIINVSVCSHPSQSFLTIYLKFFIILFFYAELLILVQWCDCLSVYGKKLLINKQYFLHCQKYINQFGFSSFTWFSTSSIVKWNGTDQVHSWLGYLQCPRQNMITKVYVNKIFYT